MALASSSPSLLAREHDRLETPRCFLIILMGYSPYSLGNTIDWKPITVDIGIYHNIFTSLLAREHDRLETHFVPLRGVRNGFHLPTR